MSCYFLLVLLSLNQGIIEMCTKDGLLFWMMPLLEVLPFELLCSQWDGF